MQGVMTPMEHTSVAVGSNNPILHLCKVGNVIAAGLSNGNICLVEEHPGVLQQIGLLKGHSAAVRGKLPSKLPNPYAPPSSVPS